VTHVSKLCSMRDNQVLGAFLPGWLNLVYSENFGWNSFTTEVLDSLVKECQTHEDTKGFVVRARREREHRPLRTTILTEEAASTMIWSRQRLVVSSQISI